MPKIRRSRILGAGPAILIPTGSDELLGSEQWGIGPTAVALKQENGWTHGILANHIWGVDVSPPDDKDKVNQTFLQPFLSYTTSTLTTWGVNTESTYNWQSERSVKFDYGVLNNAWRPDC